MRCPGLPPRSPFRIGLLLTLLLSAPPAPADPVAFGGHLYEVVGAIGSWEQARLAAEARTIDGTPGYLATITSPEELAFAATLSGGANLWLGGSDAAAEGTWAWVTGPEAGTTFWKDGAPVGGAFAPWNPGEPNNFQNEDHLALYRGGFYDWDNIQMGSLVEYSFDEAGFSFAMTDGYVGAVRNESPSGTDLVRLDLELPAGVFFDTAETPPGVEFAPLAVLKSSAPLTPDVPEGFATDGLRTATILFSGFAPAVELRLSGDVDLLSDPDAGGLATGTRVTAWFSTGAVVTGVVGARTSTILGVTYPFSVRAARPPDWDVDGVADDVDVCPGVADPAQADAGGVGAGSAPDGIGDACQCGDVSGDGRVTLADAAIVQRALLQPPAATMAKPALCDVSGDGACSLADAVTLRRALLQPPAAALASGCVPEGP